MHKLKQYCSGKNRFFFVVCIIQFILFWMFLYGDVLITAMHGINFWDCLFDGKIREFYSLNENALLVSGIYYGEYSALYDILIYIIFAVWNLPLWICKEVFGIAYILDNAWAVMWAKSISLFFLILCIIVLKKIIEFIQIDDGEQIMYMFFSSVFITAYVIVMGQYDVIPTFFILLGVYFYLKGHIWSFICCFSIASCIKIFAILLFVPLLVYKEKNIIKVIGYFFVYILPLIILRKIFPASSSNVDTFFEFLFYNKISLSFVQIPIFFLGIVLLCLFCYSIKPKENIQDSCKEIIFIGFLAFSIFMVGCFTLPYWFVYMLPFMYLIIGLEQKNKTVNIILETIISFATVLAQVIQFNWCFSGNILKNTIVNVIFKKTETSNYTVIELLNIYLGDELYSKLIGVLPNALMAISIGALCFFAVINNPWKKHNSVCSVEMKTYKIMHFTRVILGYSICFIPLLCYFYSF